MKRRAVFVGLALGALPGVSRAEDRPPPEPEYWDPGHRTTSRLPREIGDRHVGGPGDGVYGRFDGLYDVGLEAGTEVDDQGPAAAVGASIHYMFTAGARVAYSDALGDDDAKSARTLSFGVDMRPAFIPRWSNALQLGSSFGDLVIDSISLGVGAYFRQPRNGSFGDRRGLEVSLGFGLPIGGSADGPWIAARGLLRWDDPGALHAPGADVIGLFSFGWHFMVGE